MLLVLFRAVVLSPVSKPDAAVLLLPAEPSTVMLCLLLVPNINSRLSCLSLMLMPFEAVVLSPITNPDACVPLLPADPNTVMLCLQLVLLNAVVEPSVSTASMTANAIQCRSLQRI